MRNIFGEERKKPKKDTFVKKYIKFLEKRVGSLEQSLLDLQLEQKKTLETLQYQHNKTESQNQVEPPKQENYQELNETETIFHGEESTDFNEEEYVMLSKPTPARRKAIRLLEKEAVKEVSNNRREIIKGKILDELKKQELSAKELKILFVDEYQYCSKATFYRYLESLRKEQRIDSIKINGKEYLCSIPSKINNPTF